MLDRVGAVAKSGSRAHEGYDDIPTPLGPTGRGVKRRRSTVVHQDM